MLKESIKKATVTTLQESFSVLSRLPADPVIADVLKTIEDELKSRGIKIEDPLKQFKR